jgi:hypothetical protein
MRRYDHTDVKITKIEAKTYEIEFSKIFFRKIIN